MKLKHRIAAAAATLALGIVATTAQAAPVATFAADLGAAARMSSFAYKTASRHCWWRNGQRHCARRGGPRVDSYRSQGSDYYEHIPEKLPYGSQLWWDQMLRDNRAGNSGGGGRN